MPGPSPKHPDQRQRRNKEPTAATFVEDSPIGDDEIPELGSRCNENGEEIEWTSAATGYWEAIWTSPFRTEFTRVDMHGLRVLITLIDEFYRSASYQLAAEIRRQLSVFGLTNLDRRRLDWVVRRKAPEAKAPTPKRKKRREDPRTKLRAVK